ncbi:MAG: hypothetical protein EPO32_14695 [Anaerolineae bacterium]|nr:MAG: hypothetical protein EPO32_14695 [Anaerolineae bacterium]
MIVIRFEIWPDGNERRKRSLCRLDIWNDETGTDDVGNYRYKFAAADATEPIYGDVRGVRRWTYGWLDVAIQVLRYVWTAARMEDRRGVA